MSKNLHFILLGLLCAGAMQGADDNGETDLVPIANDCTHKKAVEDANDLCPCPLQYQPGKVGLKFVTDDNDYHNGIRKVLNTAQNDAGEVDVNPREVTDAMRIIGFTSDRGNITEPGTSVSFHRSKYVQLFNMIRGMPNAQRVISLTGSIGGGGTYPGESSYSLRPGDRCSRKSWLSSPPEFVQPHAAFNSATSPHTCTNDDTHYGTMRVFGQLQTPAKSSQRFLEEQFKVTPFSSPLARITSEHAGKIDIGITAAVVTAGIALYKRWNSA